ncbi:hypothetical protein ACOME3_002554 [Neoechinorhynchus agilis]
MPTRERIVCISFDTRTLVLPIYFSRQMTSTVLKSPSPTSQLTALQQTEETSSSRRREGKVFVGGLPWNTGEEALRQYFSEFGTIKHINMITDQSTGRSRGYAFVIFESERSLKKVFDRKEHRISGKRVDVKNAFRRNAEPPITKLFVGGVDLQSLSESDLREYFGRFGEIDQVDIPYDREKNVPRNFCFITFLSAESVDEAVQVGPKHRLGGRLVDVKKATPRPENGIPGRRSGPDIYGALPMNPMFHRGSPRGIVGRGSMRGGRRPPYGGRDDQMYQGPGQYPPTDYPYPPPQQQPPPRMPYMTPQHAPPQLMAGSYPPPNVPTDHYQSLTTAQYQVPPSQSQSKDNNDWSYDRTSSQATSTPSTPAKQPTQSAQQQQPQQQQQQYPPTPATGGTPASASAYQPPPPPPTQYGEDAAAMMAAAANPYYQHMYQMQAAAMAMAPTTQSKSH